MNAPLEDLEKSRPELDAAVDAVASGADSWARSDIATRISLLEQIKDGLMSVSDEWAEIASRQKQIPEGSPLEGEEWMSGPYALMSTCNGLIDTLKNMTGKIFLDGLKKRQTVTGQLAVQVAPSSIWDRLLLSGISAEVWMMPGVTKDNLATHTAGAYDVPVDQRKGVVSLVLGAGNIASIAPLDCFQKLFLEHQVVVLKLNPVNDYLFDVLSTTLAPLIALDALRIVRGGGDVGAYLCTHPGISEIHITGAEATHDLIVFGAGKAGAAAKASGKPINTRHITSELGAVCPTIVVPGPWSAADVDFQAQHLATQKMHNSGFNCIACQVLVMPKNWDKAEDLKAGMARYIKTSGRGAYYPHAEDRLSEFGSKASNVVHLKRGKGPDALTNNLGDTPDGWFENTEVFAPAYSTYDIDESDPEAYLRRAIDYANNSLHGTLGGNILIHPKTIKQIGKQRFEALIAEFRYGCIAINAWSGLGFLLTQTPWGAFPGHSLNDVQSGIGFVHNTRMFDRPERTVVRAPWRPAPRGILSGQLTLLPKPPWFITNRRQRALGMLLNRFEYRPGWLKLPRIFLNALLG